MQVYGATMDYIYMETLEAVGPTEKFILILLVLLNRCFSFPLIDLGKGNSRGLGCGVGDNQTEMYRCKSVGRVVIYFWIHLENKSLL